MIKQDDYTGYMNYSAL